MEKYDFTDRPDATRLAFGISAGDAKIDPQIVLQFLDFQWAYRHMQRQYDQLLADNDLSDSRFIILMFCTRHRTSGFCPQQLRTNSAQRASRQPS